MAYEVFREFAWQHSEPSAGCNGRTPIGRHWPIDDTPHGRPVMAAFTRRRFGHAWLVAGVAMLLLLPQSGHAGQLNLANSPLFLSTAVEPNVFVLSDDSGSMDWDMMTGESDGEMTLTGFNKSTTYSYVVPGADNNYSSTSTNGRILPSEEALQQEQLLNSDMPADYYGVWRGRFALYNVMYYNPEITYKPWAGVDSSGALFPNINPTAAPLDPFISTSPTVDLTTAWSWTSSNVPSATTGGTVDVTVSNYYPARYYTWTDTNSNGVIDAADGHSRIEILPANAPFAHATGNRSDCADPLACTYGEEIQNFANWFSYYRRREMTAKNAVGKLIAGANNVRVGYATLHNNSGANDIPIASMNPDPATGNKHTVLDGVYKTQSNQGTPLRQMLDSVGRYYECVSGNLFNASGSSCPILPASAGGTCQQNFTVLMTDGFWNGPDPSVGNADGDGNTAFDGPPYADAISNTLADVAMNYYERDLAPGLLDQVPVTAGVDNATHQHMVTYTVAFGVTGSLDPFGTKTPTDATDTDPKATGFAWPDPTCAVPSSCSSAQQNAYRIDDLWHAAYDSRGQFLSAGNPSQLSTALTDAIANITDRTGTAAAVALNSASLSTDTMIFQARFNSGESSGELRAIPLDSNGNLGALLWDAADQLKAQSAGSRTIITWNGSGGVPFHWANLNAAEQTALNNNIANVTDNFGPERVDYLRGDASKEGVAPYNFRVRKNSFKLGDIIHSAPVYVGAPPFLYPDTLESVPYSSFRASEAARPRTVYVGANDGMLHGFDADTGNERLAYVPARVYGTLNQLTDPTYTHRYYVDGSPTAGDVFYNGAWHTIVVGALRAGGEGIFALDVTDPASFSEGSANTTAMWEFTDATNPDLGYTFGTPTIAKMHNGRWAVIIGNGYNNTQNDGGTTTSTTGDAVLYIIDAQTGALIRKIDTQRGMAQSADGTTPNGLSTPAAVDADGDYVTDLIYAGDLQGNMWKFDVQSSNPTNWGVAAGSGPTPQPLFVATDASNVRQPITVRPEVANHPDGLGGFMVYFGTGKYMETGDNSGTPPQQVETFYGIWDQKGTATGNNTTVSKNKLQTQTIGTDTINGQTVRTVTDNPITAWGTSSGQFMGWQVDLPLTGEKVVADPVLRTTRMIFVTLVPDASPCGGGGTSWLMELNFRNGGPSDFSVFDVNNDGVFNSADTTSGGQFVIGINPNLGIMPQPVLIDDPAHSRELKIATGTLGNVTGIANNPGPLSPAAGRRSWRQMP